MLSKPDFIAKKVIIVYPRNGDKMSFKNDNFIVQRDSKIIFQLSCYKLFLVLIVGGFSLTTGLIEKSKKFGFSIVFLTTTFKLYATINFKMEGNTLLRKKQYTTSVSDKIAKEIIINKIENQKETIKLLRNKKNLDAIILLDGYIADLLKGDYDAYTIMGKEGVASKVYFNRIFEEFNWKGRQPRVKRDEMNLLLDIGYTILFNYIEAILNIYGFDIYKGNLHKEFYKRKSLVCDMIEPFRPIIDYRIRKSYNLGQFSNYKFDNSQGQYSLNWDDSKNFMEIILNEIVEYRECIFDYIQSYYRWIMKEKGFDDFPKARLIKNDIN